MSEEVEVSVGTGLDKFVLAQNYPNPFNPSTLIDFVVPTAGYATMKVYNLLGQEVATVFEGNTEAGRIYTARFSATGRQTSTRFDEQSPTLSRSRGAKGAMDEASGLCRADPPSAEMHRPCRADCTSTHSGVQERLTQSECC